MKHILLIFLSLLLLNACSTYKSSQKDLTFDNIRDTKKPIIPVNPATQIDNSQITYLGWIEAYVKRPTAFKPLPTKAQVNYVIASQAKQRGANAVLHVNYHDQFSVLGQDRIEARGQAVRIAPDAYAKLLQETEFNKTPIQTVDNIQYRDEDDIPTQAIISAPAATIPAPTQTVDNIQYRDKNDIPAQAIIVAPTVSQSTDTATNLETPTVAEKPQTSLTSQTDQPAPDATESVAQQNTTELAEKPATAVSCPVLPTLKYTILNDKEELLDRTELMLSNAEYLLKQSQKHKDYNGAAAAERIINLLKQQKAFLNQK